MTGASAAPWKNAPSWVRPYSTTTSAALVTAVGAGPVGGDWVGSTGAGSSVGVGRLVGTAVDSIIAISTTAVGGTAVSVGTAVGSTAVPAAQAASKNNRITKIILFIPLIIPVKFVSELTKGLRNGRWFLAHMDGNRAKHKQLVMNIGKSGLAHNFHNGVRVFELLGAVGQIAVGVGFAADEPAQQGNDDIEVDEDERP